MRNRRKIHLILSGGLGNQLFSLCAGYSLAKIQQRGLVVWIPSSINEKYQTNIWDEFEFSFLQDGIENVFVKSDNRIIDKLKLKFLRGISIFSEEQETIYSGFIKMDFDLLDQCKSKVLSRHFECLEVPQLAQSLGFPMKLTLKSESDQFKSELDRIIRENPISIHIRLGDYLKWQNGEHVLGVDYYARALERISAGETARKIWIFSDDISAAKEIFKRFSNVRFMEKKLGLSAAEEMILMSRTNGLISSKSTFSWWASFLSDYQTSVVSPHKGWRKTEWISED